LERETDIQIERKRGVGGVVRATGSDLEERRKMAGLRQLQQGLQAPAQQVLVQSALLIHSTDNTHS
jgi:hypothetical protein